MDSILNYLGGKSRIAKKIIAKIPEHTCYVEPFAGAAWVFFKKEPSKVEVLNDINSDLVNLYRVVRNHYDEFIRCCEFLPVSRQEHEAYIKELENHSDALTDIQKAVRFYYCMCCGYGGKLYEVFCAGTSRQAKFRAERVTEKIKDANKRLHGVFVENMNYDECIKRYDREHTFFYIDPPYYNCENFYGKGIFSKLDFVKLSDILSNIKGKFILSLNDTPEIREIFKQFNFEEIEVPYSVSNTPEGKRRHPELIITNF